MRQQVGELNGVWAWLLKLCLATYPFALTWGAWVTKETLVNSYFREEGPRVTRTDLNEWLGVVHNRLNEHIESPRHRDSISRQELQGVMTRLDRMDDKLDRLIAPRPG